jgi:hypothetical protein
MLSPLAPRAHRLNHPLLAQPGDGLLRIAQFGQDLVGVLAQRRGAAADGAWRLGEPHRHLGEGRRLGRAGELGGLEEAHRLDVGVVQRLLRLEHGA